MTKTPQNDVVLQNTDKFYLNFKFLAEFQAFTWKKEKQDGFQSIKD